MYLSDLHLCINIFKIIKDYYDLKMVGLTEKKHYFRSVNITCTQSLYLIANLLSKPYNWQEILFTWFSPKA